MNKAVRLLCLLLLPLAPMPRSLAASGEAALPRIFALNPSVIAQAKAKLSAGDSELQPALDRLRRDAAEALKTRPRSVMDKTLMPPSGDKHDYLSIGPYFWPNPATSNGLPYVNRDGERNPANAQGTDASAMGNVCRDALTLALAWHFTGREEYAAHATKLLRAWFLTPATRMNPHLNFGQGVPGAATGRSYGMIESRSLVQVVDAVGLLAGAKAWTAADQAGMEAWMAQFLDWARTSKLGRAEQAASNNHGVYYDAQIVSLALFTGQTNLARETLERAKQERIARQIEPDGSQPRELARTKSLSYTLFNLEAFLLLASLGDRAGVDLWHFETPDGRSLRKALLYVAPYADPAKPWPGKQITPQGRGSIGTLFARAGTVYPDAAFREALRYADARGMAADRSRLTVPILVPAAR